MFQSISFEGLKNTKRFGYAADVEFFKTNKGIEFKPGLNILFGPNGCGKSTVLQILGQSMCAVQGGTSVVTESALRDYVSSAASTQLNVVHDGQPVVFCDPRAQVGLIGGSFDDDFLSMGVREATSRASHGQISMGRADQALAILLGLRPFPTSVEYRVKRPAAAGSWQTGFDALKTQMTGRIEVGQGSVLLDEPEANYSLLWQALLWQRLATAATANNLQVIVATHSPFALGIKDANYIDLAGAFRLECEFVLRRHFAAINQPSAS